MLTWKHHRPTSCFILRPSRAPWVWQTGPRPEKDGKNSLVVCVVARSFFSAPELNAPLTLPHHLPRCAWTRSFSAVLLSSELPVVSFSHQPLAHPARHSHPILFPHARPVPFRPWSNLRPQNISKIMNVLTCGCGLVDVNEYHMEHVIVQKSHPCVMCVIWCTQVYSSLRYTTEVESQNTMSAHVVFATCPS